MAPPIRKTNFVPEWIDMEPNIPVPRIDWVEKKQLDIPYGEDEKQRLDLYYPNGKDAPANGFPLVIIVHGGGFSHMDKRDWHMYPGFFALREGFALVSVNYRLAPKNKYFDQVADLENAILHIKAHAAEWGLDAKRLFLYGTSAGGNLVTVVGLKGHSENAGYDVRGIAALCPLLSFTWIYENRRLPGSSILQRLLLPYLCRQVLGERPSPSSEKMRLASAENYIKDNIPPFYLQTGTADPAIDHHHVERFYELLSRASNATPDNLVLELLENAPHAGAGPHYLEPESILPILEFFQQQ